jgi:uncharacterized membrane protein YfcA
MEIYTSETALFLLLALLAEFLGTIGGFGSSLLFVPIASYFFDFHTALGITASFHVLSNLTKIALFKHGFNKMLVIWMGIPAVITVSIGAYFSKYLQTSWLEYALGFFLLTTAFLFFVKPKSVVEPSKQYALSGGAISGFIAGLIGTGGAIRGLALSAFNLETNVFITTSALIDLGIDGSRTVVYLFNGYMQFSLLYLLPPLLLVSFCGTYLGKKVLDKLPQLYFKKLVLLLIMATGVSMLVKAWLNQ